MSLGDISTLFLCDKDLIDVSSIDVHLCFIYKNLLLIPSISANEFVNTGRNRRTDIKCIVSVEKFKAVMLRSYSRGQCNTV